MGGSSKVENMVDAAMSELELANQLLATHVPVAQVHATMAQTYATLALVRKDDG